MTGRILTRTLELVLAVLFVTVWACLYLKDRVRDLFRR